MLKRGNHSNPLKLQQMLFPQKQVHYVSCQVTRAPCGCRNVFGADAHQDVRPTPSALWTAGSRCGELLDQTLRPNFAAFWDPSDASKLASEVGQVWNSNGPDCGHSSSIPARLHKPAWTHCLGPHTWICLRRTSLEIQLRHFLLAVVVF